MQQHCKLIDLGIVRDDEEELEKTLDNAFSAGIDILLTSGGVSMGDKDFVKPLLQKKGTIYFNKVNYLLFILSYLIFGEVLVFLILENQLIYWWLELVIFYENTQSSSIWFNVSNFCGYKVIILSWITSSGLHETREAFDICWDQYKTNWWCDGE